MRTPNDGAGRIYASPTGEWASRRGARRAIQNRLAGLLVGLGLAGLLLAPGEARAQGCGRTLFAVPTTSTITCNNAAHSTVRFVAQGSASVTINVPGGSATTISGTTTYPSLSIIAEDINAAGNYAINVGTTGAVSLTGTGRGVSIDNVGSPGTVAIDVGSQVTIGSSTSSIGEHGIRIRSGPSDGTVTNAGTIYANYEGIDAHRQGAGTLTVTHTGAITSTSSTNSPGMLLVTQGAGPMIVTTSGDVTATTSTQGGIIMRAEGNGAVTLTATGGAIRSSAEGIAIESRGTGAVTIQGTAASAASRSGPTITSSGSHGIYVQKTSAATAGDISITITGGSITAGSGDYRGIYVQDHAGYTGSVTIDNAADVTAERPIHVVRLGAGAVSVTNSGGTVLSMTRPAILAQNAASDAGDVTVSVTGGTAETAGAGAPAIHARNQGAGDVIATIAAGATAISKSAAGILAELGDAADSRIRITQGGTISGRTGVLARAARQSASGETRAAGDQPMIDVAWTGTFARDPAKTAADDEGRFPAVALDATGVERHRGAAAEDHTGRYGAPAGVEARVMDLDALLEKVAEGDDPDALMVVEAQRALLDSRNPGEIDPTDSARAALIVSQFREMLEDDNFASRLPADDDVDANDDGTYSDAEIKTYLTADNANRRTFLRALLRRGLSEGEKAVLRALTTGGGDLEAALGALPTTAAGINYYNDAWKGEVRALLNNFNVGNVRVNVTAGSIVSRGDGVRAYYLTPHDDNGSIEVTVAAGAEVTGGAAGVYAANAGLGLRVEKKYAPEAVRDVNAGLGEDDLVTLADHVRQVVRVDGTVTGGTDAAVHLSGGGALIVGETGEALAGASGRAVLVNDPGPAIIYVAGLLRGGAGDGAAIDLTLGGAVTVALTGRVEAPEAGLAIRAEGAAATVAIHVPGRDDAGARHGALRVRGVIGGTGVNREANARYAENVRYVEVVNGMRTGWSTPAEFNTGTGGTVDGTLFVPDPEAPREPGTGEQPGQRPGGGEPGQAPGTGGRQPTITFTFDCAGADDGRCRLYEALPSFLLAMNRMPSRAERMAAPRGANGVWGRVEGARGEWTADRADSAMELSYDYNASGARAGVDFEGARARAGLSVHALRAKAEMKGVGEIALNGMGFGASAAWEFGEFYADVSGQATWLDAEIDSTVSGKLEKEATGLTGALGVEVGRRTRLAEKLAVIPRLGLVWTEAGLGEFTDSVSATRVSVEDAASVRGVLGVILETPMEDGGRLFGTLDLARELADETGVKVGDAKLNTDARSTTARLGAGGAFAFSGGASLRASAWWQTSGSDSIEYGGGVTFSVRF